MNRFLFPFLLISCLTIGQTTPSEELSYNEFLGFVKKYHPLVKSSLLDVSAAQANLMAARGGFDPQIAVDFEQKQFRGSEYYSILNSSFKIPTWYGIEIKAGFDNNEGVFLNPQNTVPNQGLTSLGITVPLGQGLFINQRMADLRKAKLQINLSRSEQKLQAIVVLYDASVAYFEWKKNYDEVQLYQTYVNFAQVRFDGIKLLIREGDKPGIDSIEAGIIVKNRVLSLEDSRLKLNKAKLELSNFLWLENNIPLELADDIIPEENLDRTIQETLRTNDLLNADNNLATHPKINVLQNKLDILRVDRDFRANLLLPKIDVGYSYLSEPSYFDNYQYQDYKVGLNFYFPLFLRKERGNLRIAKFRVQDAQFELDLENVQLRNKISAQQIEIISLQIQNGIITDLVRDYNTMLTSEERLFSFGESSIFLLNMRENNLVSSQLSEINIENRYFISNAELFRILANPE
jgi:outer membrane protein TolC